MKRMDALKLQEGDLVDISSSRWQGISEYRAKVLIVTSRGGVFIATGTWELPRWVKYSRVIPCNEHEDLTERERLYQLSEVVRFNEYRAKVLPKYRNRRLRNLKPQALYRYVLSLLENHESHPLVELQAKARAYGLEADDKVWHRIGRVLIGREVDHAGWKLPGKPDSVIVMPTGQYPSRASRLADRPSSIEHRAL
jgi:hypothetical protein